jgi:protocatechuate 3,4-dioxygenase beta subunit
MLQDAMGRNISTTFTNSNGEYEFLNLSPADYFILFQVDPFAPVRRIKVTLKAGEVANRNIFIESAVGSISGSVTEDLNNDNFGDVPLEGVLITLKNDRNVTIRTTLTNEVGLYLFSDVVDGNYVVVEANLNETFVDVKDKDGGALGKRNLINVKIENGKGSIGNDFVDERYGSISGSVKDDDGEAIQSVLLELKDAFTSTVMSTTVTGANGSYNFDKLLPGDYIVQEESLEDYPIDVLDQNTAGNGDASDTDTTIDNKIHVTVTSNEDDVGNDFVDSNKGSISGNVTSTDGNPISNVVITLTDSNGTNITTITGTTGDYVFEKIAPGNYSLTETNPTGYSGCSNVADTRIEIVLGPGSKCHGNNFVKTLKSKFPTSAPSENPPVLAPSLPPIEARLAPSEYCKELDNPSCSLCAAFHSPGKSMCCYRSSPVLFSDCSRSPFAFFRLLQPARVVCIPYPKPHAPIP